MLLLGKQQRLFFSILVSCFLLPSREGGWRRSILCFPTYHFYLLSEKIEKKAAINIQKCTAQSHWFHNGACCTSLRTSETSLLLGMCVCVCICDGSGLEMPNACSACLWCREWVSHCQAWCWPTTHRNTHPTSAPNICLLSDIHQLWGTVHDLPTGGTEKDACSSRFPFTDGFSSQPHWVHEYSLKEVSRPCESSLQHQSIQSSIACQ